MVNAPEMPKITMPPPPEGIESITPESPVERSDRLEGEAKRELIETSFEDRGRKMVNEVIDSSINAGKDVFSRLQKGTTNVATGLGKLFFKGLGAVGFGGKASVETGKAVLETINEGLYDLGHDLKVMAVGEKYETPGGRTVESKSAGRVLIDMAPDLPKAAFDAWGAVFIEMPMTVIEKLKGNPQYDKLLADSEKLSEVVASEDYSPEAIARAEREDAEIAFMKLEAEQAMSPAEKLMTKTGEGIAAGIEILKAAPKASKELAKFAANDMFIEVGQGLKDGVVYMAEKASEAAKDAYLSDKAQAGRAFEGAVSVLNKTADWLVNLGRYQIENKSELLKEVASANDHLADAVSKKKIEVIGNRQFTEADRQVYLEYHRQMQEAQQAVDDLEELIVIDEQEQAA